MDAASYPVTTPWGYSADYPLNGGRHRGEDRYMPVGTPVKVNGVQIGLSGDTGYVTGPHLHIGKWINGTDFDPAGGGLALSPPVLVTDINVNPANDTLNGAWVGLRDAAGVRWVYLHLSRVDVSVGQIINSAPQGGDDMLTKEQIKVIYDLAFDVDDSKVPQDIVDAYVGKPLDGLLTQLHQDPTWLKHKQAINAPSGFVPVTDQLFKKA